MAEEQKKKTSQKIIKDIKYLFIKINIRCITSYHMPHFIFQLLTQIKNFIYHFTYCYQTESKFFNLSYYSLEDTNLESNLEL